MRYGALLCWGVVIYAVLQLLWSGFLIYGVSKGILPHTIEFLMLILLALVAGRSLHFKSWKDVLPYSLVWAAQAAVLDAIYSVPFAGWSLYAQWGVWAGYAVLVIVPLAAPLINYRHAQLPERFTS